MKFITQESLDSAVLFKLFVHAQSSDKRLNKEDISKLFDIPVSPKRVDLALDNLERREQVSRWLQNGSCSIEVTGYRAVEEGLAQPNSFMRRYAEAGDEWLETQTINLSGIPASDRVVLRSDNQKLIDDIEVELDKIETELAKNNEIGDALGGERDVLVGEIEASKVLAKAPSFRLSRLISLMVPALRFLAEKFGGTVVGEAAKHLMKLLFGLI